MRSFQAILDAFNLQGSCGSPSPQAELTLRMTPSALSASQRQISALHSAVKSEPELFLRRSASCSPRCPDGNLSGFPGK